MPIYLDLETTDLGENARIVQLAYKNTETNEVVNELAAKNKAAKKINDSYNKFYQQVSAWHEISEKIYYNVR